MTIKYIAELCQNHLENLEKVMNMVKMCLEFAKIIKLQYDFKNNL